MVKLKAVLFFLVALFMAVSVSAQDVKKSFKPRFSSMGSSVVNMRTGPGMQYPIEWVYKKRDYPVEIVDQYDVWRRIREIDGTEGWIHQGMLSSRRYGIVLEKVDLMRTTKEDAKTVAHVGPGVVVKLVSCPKTSEMCRVEVKGKHGFLPKAKIWGIYSGESF